MFSWLSRDKRNKAETDAYSSVLEGLQKCYYKKLKPLEDYTFFGEFHSPALTYGDFMAKPMVLLIGQYSTGKTSFIKYLMEQEFPGMRIGPEPTTDTFMAIMHGSHPHTVPGNALAVDPNFQFETLSRYGNNFLNKFEGAFLNNQVLESVTIIDTPGILSGEKQRTHRGYDFEGVIEWFSNRADMIILLFDAHKLDISDEFQRAIQAIRGNDDKIRIVLNKCDRINTQQLMRVYGALMWSLGKVIDTPEVSRVYIGSFWDQPYLFDEQRGLFEAEQEDLFKALQGIPRGAATRKLNDLIRRSRMIRVHAHILSTLRNQMPSMFGRDSKKEQLIRDLPYLFEEIRKQHNLVAGDFPDVARMREQLYAFDWNKLPKPNLKLMANLEELLTLDVPQLMTLLPQEQARAQAKGGVKGGAFSYHGAENGGKLGSGPDPFGDEILDEWIGAEEVSKAGDKFETLNPMDGKIPGQVAKDELLKSKLPTTVLRKIWFLSDIDKDGKLDKEEFTLCMHLVGQKLNGNDLPEVLPDKLVPPSKRS